MITRIEALNYRCLRFIQQDLAPFQILVGPNASGKTTFLDVVAVMRDVVRDGLEKAITSRAPNYQELFWQRQGRRFELVVEAEVPESRRAMLPGDGQPLCRYELAIGQHPDSEELGILAEVLRLRPARQRAPRQRELFPSPLEPPGTIVAARSRRGWRTVVNKVPGGNDNFYGETGGWDHAFKLGHRKSALANLPDDETRFPVATWFKQLLLEGVETLALNSIAMRQPCPPNVPRTFLPDGSNLAWVVHQLRRAGHGGAVEEWVRHVRTALRDLREIRSEEQPHDKHRYLVLTYDNGLEVPSWLASDGTLRLLALTLLAYLPDVRGVYLIEEPENGVHPAAAETVFQSLTSVYDGQVLLATHSPVLLSVAEVGQILCFARTRDGAVDIVPGDQHPRLKHWRGETNLGALFASGVLG